MNESGLDGATTSRSQTNHELPLRPEILTELYGYILRSLPDETLIPLAHETTKKLDQYGLLKPFKDLGISLFVPCTQTERREIASGKPVTKKEGKFDIRYQINTAGDGFAFSSSSGRLLALPNQPKRIGVTMAQCVDNEIINHELDEVKNRIHEATHFYNAPSRFTIDDVSGALMNELSAEMASQVWYGERNDQEIIDFIARSPEDWLAMIDANLQVHEGEDPDQRKKKAVDYYQRAIINESGNDNAWGFISKEPHRKDIATAVVGIIWELRALGLSEREIAETTVMFKKKNMLDCQQVPAGDSSETTFVYPKIKEWMGKKWDEKGVYTDEEQKRKVKETKEKFKIRANTAKKMITSMGVEFVNNLDLGDTIFGPEGGSNFITWKLPSGEGAGKGCFFCVEITTDSQIHILRVNPSKQVMVEVPIHDVDRELFFRKHKKVAHN